MALRLMHLFLRGIGVSSRGVYARGRSFRGIERLLVLLIRNFFFVDELLVTHHIALRFIVVGFRLRQLRHRGGSLALRRPELRREHFPHSARAESSWLAELAVVIGTLFCAALALAIAASYSAARAIHGDLIILWINLDEHRARFNSLIVVHIHFRNVACHARADQIDVAVHLGIVGRFPRGQIIPDEHSDHSDEPPQSREWPTVETCGAELQEPDRAAAALKNVPKRDFQAPLLSFPAQFQFPSFVALPFPLK